MEKEVTLLVEIHRRPAAIIGNRSLFAQPRLLIKLQIYWIHRCVVVHRRGVIAIVMRTFP